MKQIIELDLMHSDECVFINKTQHLMGIDITEDVVVVHLINSERCKIIYVMLSCISEIAGDTSGVELLSVDRGIFDVNTITESRYPNLNTLSLANMKKLNVNKLQLTPPVLKLDKITHLTLPNNLTHNFEELMVSGVDTLLFEVSSKPSLERSMRTLKLSRCGRTNVGCLSLGGTVSPCTITHLHVEETEFRCIYIHSVRTDMMNVVNNSNMQAMRIIGNMEYCNISNNSELHNIRLANGDTNVLLLANLPKLKAVQTSISSVDKDDYFVQSSINNIHVTNCPRLHIPKVEQTYTMTRTAVVNKPRILVNLLNFLIRRTLKVYHSQPDYYIGDYKVEYNDGIYTIIGKDVRIMDYTPNPIVSCTKMGRSCNLVSCNHCEHNKENTIETK